jgi:hypothetical protein
MRYSRFNEAEGVYEVWQDDVATPLNADLAVPSLPPVAGGIGVPARLAGRQLPRGAKRVGKSWHPVGIIVGPAEPGLGVLELGGAAGIAALVGGLALGVAAAWLLGRQL